MKSGTETFKTPYDYSNFKEGVVYINSALRQNDWFIVPTSITYLMNLLPDGIPRLGIFSWEISQELLAQNRVFILDCHFLFSLPEVEMICHLIRRNRPDAQIVLGGYTAQLFWKSILETFDADYIILGDNEYTFPRLITDLYQRQDKFSGYLPNLVGKDFQNPVDYVFCQEDYQYLHFCIDWFPSYQQRVDEINHKILLHMDHEFYTFPLIVVSKGCSQHCSFCLNSQLHYQKLFNRPAIPMPTYQLHRILKEIEAIPQLDQCHIYFNWPVQEYLEMFRQSHFDLDLNTQIDVLPGIEELNQLAGAFRKASFYISVSPSVYSATISDAVDIPQYIDKVENISFFVSDVQYKVLSKYSEHLIRTTDGWVIPEIFQGFQSSMRLAKRTFLEFMASSESRCFKIILDQHSYYCQHLLNYFNLGNKILSLNKRFHSPDEFLIHVMQSDHGFEEKDSYNINDIRNGS